MFTDEQKSKLIECYTNDKSNSFFYVILDEVLKVNSLSLSDKQVRLDVVEKLASKVDLEKYKKMELTAIEYADIVYDLLSTTIKEDFLK